MPTVADSSVCIGLGSIWQINLLPKIFEQILIPPEIAEELKAENKPRVVRNFIADPPSWLLIQKPTVIEVIPDLHKGEEAAISLAREMKATLIIDEKLGVAAAEERKLNTLRTANVLVEGAERKLINLKENFDRLESEKIFWITTEVLAKELKLYNERQWKLLEERARIEQTIQQKRQMMHESRNKEPERER